MRLAARLERLEKAGAESIPLAVPVLFVSLAGEPDVPSPMLSTTWNGTTFVQAVGESRTDFTDRLQTAVQRDRPAGNSAVVMFLEAPSVCQISKAMSGPMP